MAHIFFTSGAARDYKKLPPDEQKRIKTVFDGSFAEYPFASEFHTKKLQEPFSGYRLRVGHYRILFEYETDKILIYKIRQRKDAYK